MFRSLWVALLTTLICLVVAYPFAWFLSTRSPTVRNVMLVFVMIPFWSNFLVRNYAWRVLLGNDGPFSQATEAVGLGETPVCIAKTPNSLSDDPTKVGRPTGFRITVQDVRPSAGAGFVVARAGTVMTMPGLPRVPAANGMRIQEDGSVIGLF